MGAPAKSNLKNIFLKREEENGGGGGGGSGGLAACPSLIWYFFFRVTFTVHLRFWTKMGASGWAALSFVI